MVKKDRKAEIPFNTRFDERILDSSNLEQLCLAYTKPKQETRLRDFCLEKGLVHYLPVRKAWLVSHRTYKDKIYDYSHQIWQPMFTSYVFAKLTQPQRSDIFRSNAIIRLIPITDPEKLYSDIQTVRQIELIGVDQELQFNEGIREGERFRIESGPWQGICGWLLRKEKRFQWTVQIESVQGIIQATIDPSQYKLSPLTD